MKFASFAVSGTPTWGIVEGETAYDVGALLRGRFGDLKALIAGEGYAEAEAAKAKATGYPISELHWLPVIPNPDKILCVGLNYENHRRETGVTGGAHPTIFSRFANTQAAHKANLLLPRVSTNVDYEGELAVVIGRPGRYIDREDAMSHVAGYSCYNDGSVRDFQQHTSQFTPGKNFPETGGFGPWMMTPDELGELDGLRIRTILNGTVMQEAEFGQMIFDVPAIIAYCSSFTRLESGDVILTGTPGGVGMKRTPPVWLRPGDIVKVEIEGLGTLENGVVKEA